MLSYPANMQEKGYTEPLVLEKKPERSGEYLWRVLKPAGCILVLVILVLYLIFCFTYRNDPGAAGALRAACGKTVRIRYKDAHMQFTARARLDTSPKPPKGMK